MSSEITVYGKKIGCQYCEMAKNYLKSKGLEFKFIDVMEDDEALEYVKAYWEGVGKRPTVPLVVVDDFVVGGFTELKSFL